MQGPIFKINVQWARTQPHAFREMLFLGWGLGRGEEKRGNTYLQIAKVPSPFSHWTSSGKTCYKKNHRIGPSQVCSHLSFSFNLCQGGGPLFAHLQGWGAYSQQKQLVLLLESPDHETCFLGLNWNLPTGILLPPLPHTPLALLGS